MRQDLGLSSWADLLQYRERNGRFVGEDLDALFSWSTFD